MAHVKLNIEALKAIRQAGGDTQKSLAERAGISEMAYGSIETGKANPRVSTIRKLAEALSVPIGAITHAECEREAAIR